MYQCKKCGREFKKQRYLEQHNRRKTDCTAVFQCSKCLQTFATNQILQRHLKRKTPCAPEEIPVIIGDNEENRCQFCNRTYSTKSSLTRHQKTCDKGRNIEVMMRLLIEQNQQLVEEVKEIKEQNKQLVVPSNQTIINDNRQVNIINFVNFPLQDMSSIDRKKILEIAANQPTNQIIPAIVEHLHGNPKYPEKQNVFMTRINSEFTIVFGGNDKKTWHSIPRKTAVHHLKSEAMGLLTHRNMPRPNFQLIEAAHDTQYKDTEYQDKIADLAENDNTDDEAIARKLVSFGETFHKHRMQKIEQNATTSFDLRNRITT